LFFYFCIFCLDQSSTELVTESTTDSSATANLTQAKGLSETDSAVIESMTTGGTSAVQEELEESNKNDKIVLISSEDAAAPSSVSDRREESTVSSFSKRRRGETTPAVEERLPIPLLLESSSSQRIELRDMFQVHPNKNVLPKKLRFIFWCEKHNQTPRKKCFNPFPSVHLDERAVLFTLFAQFLRLSALW
jgi:hypothetical protein